MQTIVGVVEEVQKCMVWRLRSLIDQDSEEMRVSLAVLHGPGTKQHLMSIITIDVNDMIPLIRWSGHRNDS